ncbi:tetratricopeptide repeat domain-containing protein [Coemansia sp. RSA 2599]|nr:tetratricopeptide repeat domain-containing protein [Coemansia sp. RSA 2599]
MGRLDFALKEYLRVVELSTDNVRGFYGVKLTADRILDLVKNKPKKDQLHFSLDSIPQQSTLERLSLLATERLVGAYSGACAACKTVNEQWLKK